MQIKDLMSPNPIRIAPDEHITVAARTLEHYNIGALPVCTRDGKLCGMLTDRDLALRTLASQQNAADTTVSDIMTRQVITITPESSPTDAAALMAAKQIRRLPVTDHGKLCGILSLSDLAACKETAQTAEIALTGICSTVSRR